MNLSIGQRWNRFWFEPATPDNLGLARIVLYGSTLLFYLITPHLPTWGWHAPISQWGDVSTVFWRPIWLFRVLHLGPASVATLMIIDAIFKIALLLSTMGLFTRTSTAVSFVLCVYFFGLPNNYGKTEHLEVTILWAFFIFALSRCGDGWSVDRWLWRRQGKIPASGEYTWPIRMIWVVMLITYLAAAISKLRHAGLGWVTSDTMSIYLIRAQYHIANAEPLLSWGLYIARHPWLSHLFAASGLAIELSYCLALFSRKYRYIVIPSAAMMQLGVAALMGPNFYQLIICQLLWLPLDKITAMFWSARAQPKLTP